MEEEGDLCFLFQSLSNILSNLSHMTTMIEASKHRTSPEIEALQRPNIPAHSAHPQLTSYPLHLPIVPHGSVSSTEQHHVSG